MMPARERLPNRRQCESFEFRHAGLDFTLAAGFYPDGRIAEVFLSSHKPGSPIEPSHAMRPSSRVLPFNTASIFKPSARRSHATMMAAPRHRLAQPSTRSRRRHDYR
jgi:hypothetical protein